MKNTLKIIGSIMLFAIVAISVFGIPEAVETLFNIDTVGIGAVLATLPIWFKMKGEEKEFKEILDVEVLKSLSEDDQTAYVKALNAYRSKRYTEIQELVEKNEEKNSKEITELKEKYQEFTEVQFKNLTEAYKEIGLTVAKLKTVNVEVGNKMTLKQQLKKVWEENKDVIEQLKDNSVKGNAGLKFNVKVAGTMLLSTNVTGDVPQAEREAGLNRIARRSPFIIQIIDSGQIGTDRNTVDWVEQQNPDGSVGGTGEGLSKNQIDFDLVVVSESLVKRTGLMKISTEMLDDIDFIESEIRTELMQLLNLDVDDQVLQGDGTGNNVNGIVTQATAFAAGTFAGTVDDANEVDVLTVASNQVKIANFQPNWYVLHPSDVTKMRLIKATDSQYIGRLMSTADGLSLDGIPIVENNGVTIGDFLVMDGTKSKTFFKGSMEITLGLDGNDFSKNLRTFLAEIRLLNRIKGNDTEAFVTGTFVTAKAALETP